MFWRWLVLIFIFGIYGTLNPIYAQTSSPVTINQISAPQTVGKFQKFEISFKIENSIASNFQWPYDANPPAGISASKGISVDGMFSNDNGLTWETVPGFYYQEFADQIKNNREWFYPTGNYIWKIRFSPNKIGNWQYKIRVQDASGTIESQVGNFSVTESNNSGFIKVAEKDSRYFEFSDGKYFPALGYNMNFDQISWNNPVLDNQDNFAKMNQNGIQLVRLWLSQWSIFGSSWNPWYSMHHHDTYIPRTGITALQNQMTMKISAASNWFDSCMMYGYSKAQPAVLTNSTYRIKVRYRGFNLTGPRNSGLANYGLVAKVGSWIDNCQDGGTGTVVTNYGQNNSDWGFIEGSWNSGNANFLPLFYLAAENANTGDFYVDTVEINQDLGNGNFGPNIIYKPSMEHQKYFDQRNSFAFDKLLDLAKTNGVYLRPVILEKNEDILLQLGADGNFGPENSNNFYGNFRNTTAGRWYLKAWWRYLAARWGYSTQIQSWELLNEGDPASDRHFTLADEFGKYMHQFRANKHLVSTSFWNSFPKTAFWENSNYPDIDFADVHQYIPKTDPNWADPAKATLDASNQYKTTKPVIRGETGFTDTASEPPSAELLNDINGLWLHNFIWAGMNSGGLIESYWYANYHIYQRRQNGTFAFDFRPIYGSYYKYIKDENLNDGNWQDLGVVSTPGSKLRVVGQKNLVTHRAIVWVQNSDSGANAVPINQVVTIGGFEANKTYDLETWDTFSGSVSANQNIQSNALGNIEINIVNLTSDKAYKINSIGGKSGDANSDSRVDGIDYVIWLNNYNTSNPNGVAVGDFNTDSRIDGLDYVIWLNNYGV